MGPKELGGAVLILAAGFVSWTALRPGNDAVAEVALRLDTGAEVPAIGLARLTRTPPSLTAPARDVFKFGHDPRADLAPLPSPVIRLSATPLPTPEAPPTPTPWPTLNLSLVGIVDNGAGRKIASFLKDGDILLVGEAGQIMGNAFRVIRVGIESAEIEELGSGRTRRLPLKTN